MPKTVIDKKSILNLNYGYYIDKKKNNNNNSNTSHYTLICFESMHKI